jgi:hypothetical protein
VEALAVDFDKGLVKQDWPIDMCPDPDRVRVEITGVEGVKCKVEPPGPMPSDKATAWVKIEDGAGILSLKVDATMKRDFQVSVTPHIKLTQDPNAKPEKFNRRALQQATTRLTSEEQYWDGMVKQGEGMIKVAPENQKHQLEPRLALARAEHANRKTQVEGIQKLDALLKGVVGGMKIKMRVFFDADSSEVTLLKIGG